MLKAYLPGIYDMENYGAARASFTSGYLKKEWMDYARKFVSTHYPTEPVIVYEPTHAELSQI